MRSVSSRSEDRQTPAKRREILNRVRRACLALPDTHEKEAWGAPTFRAGGRLFVMFVDDHHGDGRLAIWCTAPPGAQDALVASDPERFFVPPYVGPQGWVGVRLDVGLRWPVIAQRIKSAHLTMLSKQSARPRGHRARPRSRAGGRRR